MTNMMQQKSVEHYLHMLMPMYNDRYRYYHDLTHIYQLQRLIDGNNYLTYMTDEGKNAIRKEKSIRDVNLVLEYIAWFHDCYYDAYNRSGQNEEKSRKIFEAVVGDSLDCDTKYTIVDGIMATAKHTEDLDISRYSSSTLLFMDLDLFTFSDHDECKLSSDNIRKEYYKTSDEDYRKGRVTFLRKMLERKKIYYYFNEELEKRARFNILMELDNLIK